MRDVFHSSAEVCHGKGPDVAGRLTCKSNGSIGIVGKLPVAGWCHEAVLFFHKVVYSSCTAPHFPIYLNSYRN